MFTSRGARAHVRRLLAREYCTKNDCLGESDETRGWQAFSEKGQIVNISGIVGQKCLSYFLLLLYNS